MIKLKGDKTIWAVMILLALTSILVVYSSIVTLAVKHHEGNTFYYLMRHGFFLIVGLGLMYAVHQVKYTYFSRLAQIGLFVSIPLLIVTMFFGANYNNASRWLEIPVINQTFQTSDLAKLALIMFLARIMSHKGDDIKDYKNGFLKILVPVIIVCALIFRADFSTSLALFITSIILMFIGGARILHILSILGAGVVVLAFVFTISKAYPDAFPRATTWVKRIECFFTNCPEDPNANHQVKQAKISVASGGVIGKGP
ncbi:MAG: FtsW/RodA/SpoVE family cell cycle protein, partial [Flavobacteriales bacterium]|nr:FtsW/RodA/SpoVE family cell cycle protein [Flavobacteriales bacterium]